MLGLYLSKETTTKEKLNRKNMEDGHTCSAEKLAGNLLFQTSLETHQ